MCLAAPLRGRVAHPTLPSLRKGPLTPALSSKRGEGEKRGHMVKKIALEEHFLSPGFEDYWKTTTGEIAPAIFRQVVARLGEFGERRLAQMDRDGIDRAVLSIAGPGVPIERDTATAVRRAR